MKAPREEVYKHSPNTAWRRISEEAVVLDLRSSVYYSLNETAARIWESLGERLTCDQIVERLCAEYDTAEARARKDVSETLRQMLKSGILVAAS